MSRTREPIEQPKKKDRLRKQYFIENPDWVRSEVQRCGGILAAARALAPDCEGPKGSGGPYGDVQWSAVQKWIAEALMPARHEVMRPYDPEVLNRLAKLLTEYNIPPEAIGSIDNVKVKSWGVAAKNKHTQEIITKDLHSTTLVLLPKEKYQPKWTPVQPAAPTIITYKPRETRPWTVKTVTIVPDAQIGFLRDFQHEKFNTDGSITGRHWTIHDPLAIDVSLQIIADLQPDSHGYVGDLLDLNEMSRWLQHEEFVRTTQPALDETERIIAEYESAAGDPRYREHSRWVKGNHERRFREYVLKNARAAYDLRPAMSTPDAWPSFSLESHLHIDKYGIETMGEYPNSEWWLTDDLLVRHDPIGTKSKGGYDASLIVGHTHRRLISEVRRHGQFGSRVVSLFEIGCLCRVDDENRNTPTMRRSLMPTPVPSDRYKIGDWTQVAAAVVTLDGDHHEVELPIIHTTPDGGRRCTFRGRVYSAYPKERIAA